MEVTQQTQEGTTLDKPPKVKSLRDEGWVSFAEGAKILGKNRGSVHRYAWETGEISLDDVRSVDDGSFYVVRYEAIMALKRQQDSAVATSGGPEEFTNLRDELRVLRKTVREWAMGQGLAKSKGTLKDEDEVLAAYDKAHRLRVGTTAAKIADLEQRMAAAWERLQDIRNWGRDNGFQVATKGYIAPRLLAAYNEAHPPARKRAHKAVTRA